MFVAINRIRACDDPRQFLDYEPVAYPDPNALLTEPKPAQPKEEVEQPPIALGERVVWMSDYGPEHGLVRWVGFLHDTREREWTVGVEFVSAFCSGAKKEEEKSTFAFTKVCMCREFYT